MIAIILRHHLLTALQSIFELSVFLLKELLQEARELVCQMLEEHSPAAMADWEELRVEVRKILRRLFNKTMARRPLILPVIMEL